MKTLFVHIGVHKTGSTAIQKFLYQNREKLLNEYNLYYPELKDDTFFFQHNALVKIANEGKMEDFLNILNEYSGKAENVLISSETFSDHAKGLVGLKEAKKIFDRIKIIVYFRRQDTWLESFYKQSVQEYRFRITGTFHEWMYDFLNGNIDWYPIDWYKFIQPWDAAFGTENIIIRPYEKSQYVGGTIQSDFCSIFDIPFQDLQETKAEIHNISLGLEATDFLRLTNKMRGFLELRELAKEVFAVSGQPSSGVYLGHKERKRLISRFRVSNNHVAKKYLKNQHAVLFREEVKERDSYPAVFTPLQFNEIVPKLTGYILKMQKKPKNN